MKSVIIGLALLCLVPTGIFAALDAIDFRDFLEEWWDFIKQILAIGCSIVAAIVGILLIANGLTGGALW